MSRNYLGKLSEHDPLHGYLQQDIQPQISSCAPPAIGTPPILSSAISSGNTPATSPIATDFTRALPALSKLLYCSGIVTRMNQVSVRRKK